MSTYVTNENGVRNVKNRIMMKAQSIEVLKTQMMLALKVALVQNLASELGDKYKHFDVQIAPGALGFQISIVAQDDIGRFIYYGTKAHPISSSDAMPIGGGNFAMSVSHPGTAGLKQKIDAIVLASVIQARAIGAAR